MYEFTIENRQTLEIDVIFGRNVKDAFKRANLLPFEWNVIRADYID